MNAYRLIALARACLHTQIDSTGEGLPALAMHIFKLTALAINAHIQIDSAGEGFPTLAMHILKLTALAMNAHT